jgi:hypothetical protein
MSTVAYYEAFAYNPQTCSHDVWKGTATLDTIRKAGLKADLSHPMYADKSLAKDGWACKAK